jgi:hypothetical protein
LQYSRQLSFFHCKITNTISAQQCDCEKITSVAENKSEQNLPAQKSTIQTLADEYYTSVTTCFNFTAIINSNSSHAAFLASGYTFCYGNNLLKPPQG